MSRMPSVGDVIDDVFRVDEELDHGNFGGVYKVTDLLEHQILAMKVLKPGPHDEQELRQRFEREARLIYNLNHPHVVQVYYYGETDSDLPYMAMEYLQGTDLKKLIRHHGELSEALARRISIESLAALHTAHERGVVHRDLKPGNIYLVNDGSRGHVKVLDFGFAKALEKDDNREITNAGTLVGTPAYMSPELVHKRNVGPPADIYAMGLILAEMLAGDKIVQIEKIYDTVMFQGAEDKPIEFPESLDESPFRSILEKSTAKRLDDRYESACEMIDDLRQLDLPGVGTFDEEIPLHTEPPELGDDPQGEPTRPMEDGRPPVEELEAELEGDTDHPPVSDIEDDDPTVDRQYSFEVAPATGASHTGSSPDDRPIPEEFENEFATEASPEPNPTRESGRQQRANTPVERPSDSTSPPRQRPSRDSRPTPRDGRPERPENSSPPRERTPTGRTARRDEDSGPSVATNEPEPTGMKGPAADAAPAEASPVARPDDEPSALRDIIVGALIGAVVLAAILAWMHYA